MNRRRVQSGAPWEESVGYSRALRVGNTIYVAGTTATENGEPVAPGDAYRQAQHVFATCLRAIGDLGGSAADVVRTRMYVTDIDAHADGVGRAHAEAVGAARPVATMVEVTRLIDPALVVEVELEAVVGSE